MKSFREFYHKLRIHLAGQYDRPKLYEKYYGIKIGEKTRITGKLHLGSEPFLIEVGRNVRLTQEIRFITHGGVSIFRDKHPGLNFFGRIKIGDNVIIGSSAIICPNVTIGDNVIVGAGSVVTKSIPSNSIAGGNPAKVITSIEEYKDRKLKTGVYIFEKDPKKRKEEILRELENKEKELGIIK